tara:strand:- start:493 stop:828 length:336 start_codon:yes stop_codon:yes gene_type:complete
MARTVASKTAKADPAKKVDGELLALKKVNEDLKKEVASLKGQCHSCCADLADVKKSLEVLSGKLAKLEQPKEKKPDQSLDPRVDKLLGQQKQLLDAVKSVLQPAKRKELGL